MPSTLSTLQAKPENFPERVMARPLEETDFRIGKGPGIAGRHGNVRVRNIGSLFQSWYKQPKNKQGQKSHIIQLFILAALDVEEEGSILSPRWHFSCEGQVTSYVPRFKSLTEAYTHSRLCFAKSDSNGWLWEAAIEHMYQVCRDLLRGDKLPEHPENAHQTDTFYTSDSPIESHNPWLQLSSTSASESRDSFEGAGRNNVPAIRDFVGSI